MKKKSKSKKSSSLADKLCRLPYHLGLFILAFPLAIVVLKIIYLVVFLFFLTWLLRAKESSQMIKIAYHLSLYIWLWIVLYFGFLLSVILTGLFAATFISVLRPYLY